MKKYVSVSQAQRQLSAILRDVYHNDAVYIIMNYNVPIAILRKPEEWRQITINKTEKEIEKLMTQISTLLSQFY